MGNMEDKATSKAETGTLEKGVRFLEYCCTSVAFVAFVLILAIIVIGTLARYLFNYPLSFVEEYSGYLLVVMGFLGMASALRREAHVNVDVIMRAISRKAQAKLELADTCLAVFFSAILFWVSLRFCYENHSIGMVSSTMMETPLWVPQLFIPLGWGIFIMLLFVRIIRKLREKQSM
jgi:TRAP-type C4-dicarboxylate transport system permease small subunit